MDSNKRPLATHLAGLETELEEIVRDVGRKMAGQHDLQTIEEVVSIIAQQFHGARITVFLPILIKKKTVEHLRTLRL